MPFFLMNVSNIQGSTGGPLPFYQQGSHGEYAVVSLWGSALPYSSGSCFVFLKSGNQHATGLNTSNDST